MLILYITIIWLCSSSNFEKQVIDFSLSSVTVPLRSTPPLANVLIRPFSRRTRCRHPDISVYCPRIPTQRRFRFIFKRALGNEERPSDEWTTTEPRHDVPARGGQTGTDQNGHRPGGGCRVFCGAVAQSVLSHADRERQQLHQAQSHRQAIRYVPPTTLKQGLSLVLLGCCDVISELDVRTIKIMSEICETIIKQNDDEPLTEKEVLLKCRGAVLETCGIDISAVLQQQVRLGQSVKQIIEEVRSLNGSLCLKYNFGVAPWKLGVPHRIVTGQVNSKRISWWDLLTSLNINCTYYVCV